MNKEEQLNHVVTLMHYKEPLKAVPKVLGFGYYGALSGTLDGEKIQCHICGKLYKAVGPHAQQAHKVLVNRYREMFDLARSTALISEKEREKRKQRTISWMKTLTKKDLQEIRRRQKRGVRLYREKYIARRFKIRLETKNKRGVCPDQLIAKIQEAAKSLGHTPTKNEFIDYCKSQRFVHLIYATFGSWTKALSQAKLTPSQPKTYNTYRKYSDDELLDYLSIFYTETGRVPTETDCRRGFIPTSEVYSRRFGSLPKAREKAGIREEPLGRYPKK